MQSYRRGRCFCVFYYVVEQANIDGIVIWQASDGKVYQTNPKLKPLQIAESLSEYILEN